jgi:hypothetical protein
VSACSVDGRVPAVIDNVGGCVPAVDTYAADDPLTLVSMLGNDTPRWSHDLDQRQVRVTALTGHDV